MIKEFTSSGYKYVLAGPVLIVSKVKLNGVDISKYLSNNTKISWHDVSKNSGRDVTNADDTMVLDVINTKWQMDLVSRPLTEDEVVDFYAEIIKAPTLSVDFLNQFTKQQQNISCYRGNRVAQSIYPTKHQMALQNYIILSHRQ